MKAFLLLFVPAVCLLAADAPEDFRWSRGKVYNIQKSTNWVRIKGPVWIVDPNYVGVSNYVFKVPKSKRDPGPHFVDYRILVFNYPGRPYLNEHISFLAMKVGETNWNGEPIDLWDYGTTNQTQPPKK
jgi:hypothetical protein